MEALWQDGYVSAEKGGRCYGRILRPLSELPMAPFFALSPAYESMLVYTNVLEPFYLEDAACKRLVWFGTASDIPRSADVIPRSAALMRAKIASLPDHLICMLRTVEGSAVGYLEAPAPGRRG